MKRTVRCQAVILRDNHILVARQFNIRRNEEYWLLPGGGLEAGETDEECIRRELREETNLEVEIDRVLFDEPGLGTDVYKRYVTFLCYPQSNNINIGSETVNHRKILELVWCSILDEESWNEYLLRDQFFPSMRDIKRKLLDIQKELK